jgi:hypothetical protein
MPASLRRPISPLIAACALAGTLAQLTSGCATDDEARRAADEQERLAEAARSDAPKHPGRHAPEADPVPGMKVDSELGVMDTADVEDTLQARFDDVRACYERAGKAREYAGGRVVLHFLVDGTGHAEDVWVVESTLGNFEVERCLVGVGRSVVFPAPSGHKIDRDLATFLPQLASCGPLSREPVNAIIYIDPTGFPGSVGLAVGSALDESAGQCVVRTIQRWKMSATLPGKMLRANFSIPVYVASAEPASKHAASSASGRRRRR